MVRTTTRRRFLASTLTTGVALSASLWDSQRVRGANERLNIGAIGVGGRGYADLMGVARENIVAICDIDERTLGNVGKRFKAATPYTDYRKLLDQKGLDAVTVGTPDHHHAPATVRALTRGLHVYCEKPLTHTVQEARIIATLTKEKKVATQMGTQNHQHPGYLRAVELLKSGAIGQVREAHIITDRPGNFWPQGMKRPDQKPSVPSYLKWDMFLGPAPDRPYHPAYVPFKWRGWWDFGCGAIGDMAIHLMDPTYWALDLNAPVKVISEGPEPVLPECGPTWMKTTFEFGQRGDLKPCKIYWYEGKTRPDPEIADLLPMNGTLWIGEKGKMSCEHDKHPVLLPKEQFKDFKGPDPFLPTSPGHHRQWIEAAKRGTPTGSNFEYAGPFTELVHLGNVAYRVGKAIDYDPKLMKITNDASANRFLAKEYRKGWEVGPHVG